MRLRFYPPAESRRAPVAQLDPPISPRVDRRPDRQLILDRATMADRRDRTISVERAALPGLPDAVNPQPAISCPRVRSPPRTNTGGRRLWLDQLARDPSL